MLVKTNTRHVVWNEKRRWNDPTAQKKNAAGKSFQRRLIDSDPNAGALGRIHGGSIVSFPAPLVSEHGGNVDLSAAYAAFVMALFPLGPIGAKQARDSDSRRGRYAFGEM